jgi:hypothetical protein
MASGDYEPIDLMRACRDAAGFQYGKGLINAFAISMAENSGRNLTAVFTNSDQWSSRDRGPFQINDHWHPEVTDACAFNLACSAKAAYTISKSGTDFGSWATWGSGAYKQYLDLGYTTYNFLLCQDKNKLLTDERDSLKVQVGSLGSQIDSANRQIVDLQGQLANVKLQLDTSSAGLAKAQADLAVALSQVSDLQAKYDACSQSLVDANSKLAAVTTERDSLQNQVNDFNRNVVKLRDGFKGLGIV